MSQCCWGCGCAPRAGVATRASAAAAFQFCPVCIEEGCEPCAFCSPECLRNATPRHKEFHREKRRLSKLAEEVAARHWSVSAAAAPVASAYDLLLDSMTTSMSIGSSSASLGGMSMQDAVQPAQSDVMQAAVEYVAAVERTAPAAGMPTSLAWAERAICAYALMSNISELAAMPRPSWWADDALKAMSLQVLGARPDYVLAWRLRGEVLCARLGGANWLAAPRSSLELSEAGRCLQRAATFSGDELAPADKEQVVRQAVACLRAARAASEAEHTLSAASSRTSSPPCSSLHMQGPHGAGQPQPPPAPLQLPQGLPPQQQQCFHMVESEWEQK